MVFIHDGISGILLIAQTVQKHLAVEKYLVISVDCSPGVTCEKKVISASSARTDVHLVMLPGIRSQFYCREATKIRVLENIYNCVLDSRPGV